MLMNQSLSKFRAAIEAYCEFTGAQIDIAWWKGAIAAIKSLLDTIYPTRKPVKP